GKGDANPSGYGLLAHELTHAAGSDDSTDEEPVARQVEANVQSAAQRLMPNALTTSVGSTTGDVPQPEPHTSTFPGVVSPGPTDAPQRSNGWDNGHTVRASTPIDFNGLPAPWE